MENRRATKLSTVEIVGDSAQAIQLDGRATEPDHTRIRFPGGEVDVARTTDGDYWVHISVEEDGKLVDARLDTRDKHASHTDVGDFADPNLYHLAVRVASK